MKKIVAPLALAALAAGGLSITLASGADAATTVRQVRSTDFVAALSDTRVNGHYAFLREGLRVYTDGSGDVVNGTNTDKAAEYVAASGSLPASGSLQWFGTAKGTNTVTATPQNTGAPGSQIVFDTDATTGNGNDYNVLVGEEIYSTAGAGQPITDWWYTGGQARAAQRGFACPSIAGGFGGDCHGTLAQWKALLPAARVAAVGFSLGSGIKGDGVLRSLSFDDTTYEFTSTPVATTPTTSPTTTPTTAPTPAPTAVTGRATVTSSKLKAVVRLTSDKLATGAVQGAKLTYEIRVDGKRAAVVTQGAGESEKLVYRFAKRSGRHTVVVTSGGKQVATGVVRS